MGKNILIALLGIFIAILLFQGCDGDRKYKNSLEQILALNQNRQELQRTIDEQGREIVSTHNIILTKTKEVEEQLKEIAELKTLSQKVIFKTETKYKTLEVPVYDTIVVYQMDTIEAKKFTFDDPWLSLSAQVLEDKVIFDSLKVNNQYNIEFGESKGGIFKRREQMVYIRNENPHSTTKDVVSFKLEAEKKWYQRGVWKFVGGGLAFLLVTAL